MYHVATSKKELRTEIIKPTSYRTHRLPVLFYAFSLGAVSLSSNFKLKCS